MANGPAFTDSEIKTLRDHPYANQSQLARLLPNRPAASSAHRLRRLAKAEGFECGPLVTRVRIPDSDKERFENPIHLPGPSCVALFDVHLPYHDADFIEDVVNLGVAWGIDTLVIGGDLLDAAAFSKFGPDPEEIFEEELDAAERFLAVLTTNFKTVAACVGNHEARIFKTVNRQIKVKRFSKMITDAPNFEITSFEWIEMDGPEGDLPWLLAHPKNASVIAGRVPSMIASRSRPNHHVVSGHGHMCGKVRTDDNRRWAIDSGCCLDPLKIEYVTKSVSTRPAMAQGAVIIYEGYPWLLTPVSDFQALARMYRKES